MMVVTNGEKFYPTVYIFTKSLPSLMTLNAVIAAKCLLCATAAVDEETGDKDENGNK
jgi:hypothetical protein